MSGGVGGLLEGYLVINMTAIILPQMATDNCEAAGKHEAQLHHHTTI